MWILTQNQERFINCEDIWVSDNKVLGIRSREGCESYVILGKFESEEREKKVLFNIFSVQRKKHFSFIMPEK